MYPILVACSYSDKQSQVFINLCVMLMDVLKTIISSKKLIFFPFFYKKFIKIFPKLITFEHTLTFS